MTSVNSPITSDHDGKRQHAAIDSRDFRNALGAYATGVTVITAMGPGDRPIGLTCNSFASVSLSPPLVLWSLVSASPNLSAFQQATHFTVNVLAAPQEPLAKQFAARSDDKFAGVVWRRGLGGAPVLDGAAAVFECRGVDRYYGGDHVIFLGAVEAYAYNHAVPLLFLRGQFGQFASA